MMNINKYLLLMCFCFMSSCATHKMTPPDTTQTPGSQKPIIDTTQPLNPVKGSVVKQKDAKALSTWEISGAIAAKNQQKGWTATLNWQQQGPNQYHIRLFGPLGGGTIIIEKNGAVITYTDGPKKFTSRNADELLHQQTGVRLPVRNLYYWVRGLPAPGSSSSLHYDSNHNLSSFAQDGYLINSSNYSSVNTMSLPGKYNFKDMVYRLNS